MMWYTHVTFAVLLFLILKIPLALPWLSLPVCLLAALLPDIDHRGSKIGRKMSITSRLVTLVFNHRGIIHSLAAAVAFFVVIMVASFSFGFSITYGYAFLLGYASHLFMDSLNPRGVAWLAPLVKHRVRSHVRTNSIGELIVLVVISGLAIANAAKLLLL